MTLRFKGTLTPKGKLSAQIKKYWAAEQRVVSSDILADDRFGGAIALSPSGNTVMISSRFDDNARGTDAGSVYVFTRSGGTWTQQQKLTASDGQAGDLFGQSIALSADENIALVGAHKNNAIDIESGAVYVFTRSGGTWTQQQKLTASDAQAYDYFGWDMDISADGNTALIGAYGEDTKGATAGAVYVFTRSGGTWTQQQKLTASDGEANDEFGISVAISSDGNTAIVGAQRENTNGSNSGAVYVFTRSGSTWTQQQKLIASDGQIGDSFGRGTCMTSDGSILFIGANANASTSDRHGAVYVFTRSGNTWTEQQKLTASDNLAENRFGTKLAVHTSNKMIAIGAQNKDNLTGAVYIFVFRDGVWTEERILTAGIEGSAFGYPPKIADDYTIVVGSSLENSNAGAAYFYMTEN